MQHVVFALFHESHAAHRAVDQVLAGKQSLRERVSVLMHEDLSTEQGGVEPNRPARR